MSQQEEGGAAADVNEGVGVEMEPPPQLQPDPVNAPPIETSGGIMPPEGPPPEIPPPENPPPENPPPENPPIENENVPIFRAKANLPDHNTSNSPPPPEEKPFLLPIYIYTAIFGAIFLFGPLLVRRGPNVGITRCCIMLSAFCCWLFWMTTYIVQLNPLLGPRLSNETLAWIGYKWGKNPADVPDEPTHGGNNTTSLRRSFYDTDLASNLTAVIRD